MACTSRASLDPTPFSGNYEGCLEILLASLLLLPLDLHSWILRSFERPFLLRKASLSVICVPATAAAEGTLFAQSDFIVEFPRRG